MRRTRSTVTAAAALAVAAVTGAWAGMALATSQPPDTTQEFDVSTPVGTTRQQPNADSSPRNPQERRTPEHASPNPPPRLLQIPALGVAAPVVATGVTRAGNAEIPQDGDVVGWYEFGSAPGDERGSAVLIGHRDTEAEGPGALYDLDALRAGATLTVRSGQSRHRYEVVALRSVAKAGLPDALFRRGGSHQLVVITCGGPFIPESGGYQENLFIVAAPKTR